MAGIPLLSCRFARLGFCFLLVRRRAIFFAHMGKKQIGFFFAQKKRFFSPPEGFFRGGNGVLRQFFAHLSTPPGRRALFSP